MEVLYRTARAEECVVLAEGINKTAGGILDFLYHDLLPGQSTVELVAGFLAEGGRYDSYSSITVAEHDNQVIGLVSSYPANFHCIDPEMEAFFPKERLDAVRDFFCTRVEDSYYLSAVYVDEDFRGFGIGTELITITKKKAKALGYNVLSLLVMADNETALKVYAKNGFKKVKHVELNPNEFIPHVGGVYLLACEI
ncbi:MAG: GNAT family N-acetyltransferase [Veillonellaceae bacterium]|jgi:ribosomal protein S18 acetylase RimI-like enzyme|nr:GNAT family N-acetyltransferase [Veillonellaceae bacterium]